MRRRWSFADCHPGRLRFCQIPVPRSHTGVRHHPWLYYGSEHCPGDPNYYPLTLGLASWNAQASANGGAQLLYTLVLTGSLISILPLIVAFLFLQRYWQGGLTLGSIRS